MSTDQVQPPGQVGYGGTTRTVNGLASKPYLGGRSETEVGFTSGSL